MVNRGEIVPLRDGPSEIMEKATTYFAGLQAYFASLSDTERGELSKKYGSGAPTRLRRIFQRAIHQHRDDFEPEGLLEYWRDQSKQFNVDTYSGAGPFTVFAPTNAAFAKLPAGTVDTLLQPANKAMLQSILTYHVVPGRLTAANLMSKIRAGGGSAPLTTVNGAILTARMMDGGVVLVDGKGGISHVTQANVMQSNGVIHVTDSVSIPG